MGGILDEDQPNLIFKKPFTALSNLFLEIRLLIKQLSENGVLVGICSKNNYADVEATFNDYDLGIPFTCFISKKINWLSKSHNISQIAQELNIGLDSIVFLDDSERELEEVSTTLPLVKCFRVPQNIWEYPLFFMNEILPLFPCTPTSTDTLRNISYLQNQDRINFRSVAKSFDYYQSLKTTYKLKSSMTCLILSA